MSLVCPKWFAAMGCLAWKETASAAGLSAEHVEEAAVPGGTAARFVEYVFVSCPQRVLHDKSSPLG